MEDAEEGQRLDRYLADRIPSLSRSQVEKLISERRIRVDGAIPTKAGHRLRKGELIEVTLPPPSPAQPTPEDIPLSILYEDEALLAVDKPAGMVVHPAPGHESGTLVNALLFHRPELSSLDRAGLVHRLDRYASGVLLVAKTEGVRRALQRQFRRREVRKTYLALVKGRLEPRRGRIEAPVGRHPRYRKRMAVVINGRPASTAYQVQAYLKKHTLLEVRPETGRTHQIRVHLSSIGHPVAGDRVYGRCPSSLGLERFFLHACRLEFIHPISEEWMKVRASLPAELGKILEKLGANLTSYGLL